MSKKKVLIFSFIFFIFSTNLSAYKIPNKNKIHFDIIRKGKDIGDHIINFKQKNDQLIVTVDTNIKVKVAFVVVYRFEHHSVEIWNNKSLINFSGKTIFEDDREYDVSIKDLGDIYEGSGMDGKFQFSKHVLPSNYWNINVMNENQIFDTQKGIIRETSIKNLGIVELDINDKKIKAHKYVLNANKHPKDKGPFSETTILYNENHELIQFSFNSTKDDTLITIIRSTSD